MGQKCGKAVGWTSGTCSCRLHCVCTHVLLHVMYPCIHVAMSYYTSLYPCTDAPRPLKIISTKRGAWLVPGVLQVLRLGAIGMSWFTQALSFTPFTASPSPSVSLYPCEA